MSTDNWLIKLCSEQPTNEAELEQALGEMAPEQLMALDAAPAHGLDSMESKIAFADQLGREMAIENPGALLQAEQDAAADVIANLSDEDAVKLAHDLGIDVGLEKVAFLGALKGLAGKALSSGAGRSVMNVARKNPKAALAAGGALAGGVHSKATGGSFAGGAALGAGLGAGAGAMGGGRALRKGMVKAQKWGRRANKSALGGQMNMPVASAIGKSTPIEYTPQQWGNFAKKARAEKDASLLSVMGAAGKTTKMTSAYAKPAMKGMVARTGGKVPKLPGMTAARAKGTPPPIPKMAAVLEAMRIKTAMYHDHKNEWLEQFEGTPLLQAALDMAKQELASETESIDRRAEEKMHRQTNDDGWDQQEKLRLQKKDLELQLIAQRNGLASESGEGDQGGEPAPDPAAQGEEAPPPPDAGPAEAAVESAPGQEAVGAIKEAGLRWAANSPFL